MMKSKIGSKLFHIREERKMSQAEFANFLNIPLTSYARIEKNESYIELDKIVDIADRLGMPINELLPDTLSIHNNNSDKASGGVFFGNQFVSNNYYGSEADAIRDKDKEIEALRRELEELKKMFRG